MNAAKTLIIFITLVAISIFLWNYRNVFNKTITQGDVPMIQHITEGPYDFQQQKSLMLFYWPFYLLQGSNGFTTFIFATFLAYITTFYYFCKTFLNERQTAIAFLIALVTIFVSIPFYGDIAIHNGVWSIFLMLSIIFAKQKKQALATVSALIIFPFYPLFSILALGACYLFLKNKVFLALTAIGLLIVLAFPVKMPDFGRYQGVTFFQEVSIGEKVSVVFRLELILWLIILFAILFDFVEDASNPLFSFFIILYALFTLSIFFNGFAFAVLSRSYIPLGVITPLVYAKVKENKFTNAILLWFIVLQTFAVFSGILLNGTVN